jgi:phosphoribosylaminoimidazole (AIR) synthetase
MNKKLFTYKKSGVNIDAADSFVNFISSVSSKKKGKKKFSNIGGLDQYLVFQIILNSLKLLPVRMELVLKLKLLTL